MQQYSAEDAIPRSQPPHAVTAVQMGLILEMPYSIKYAY